MIRLEDAGDQLTITIARPDKANALTEAMLNEMAERIERTTAKALVLTGEGSVFSAGADLDDVRNGTLATSPAWERLSAAVAEFTGLSIAALNGSCAGGAMGMILACDLRIAVAGAKFFYPVIKIGVLPQPSDPARLVALVGPSVAKRILMTGAKLSADEARSAGLVDVITEDLASETAGLVAPVLAAPSEQVAAIKALIAG